MSKKPFILFALIAICLVFIGCSKMAEWQPSMDPDPYYSASSRLIIQGVVSDSKGTGIPGIHVAVYDVREEDEPDILTYNYAITDSTGKFTIIRYRGWETPEEVTVVATDPAGIYQEQILTVPVIYKPITEPESHDSSSGQVINGYVTAEFSLEPN